jgi:hypothetical protein
MLEVRHAALQSEKESLEACFQTTLAERNATQSALANVRQPPSLTVNLMCAATISPGAGPSCHPQAYARLEEREATLAGLRSQLCETETVLEARNQKVACLESQLQSHAETIAGLQEQAHQDEMIR